jgi:hypothetical protein
MEEMRPKGEVVIEDSLKVAESEGLGFSGTIMGPEIVRLSIEGLLDSVAVSFLNGDRRLGLTGALSSAITSVRSVFDRLNLFMLAMVCASSEWLVGAALRCWSRNRNCHLQIEVRFSRLASSEVKAAHGADGGR